MQFKLLKIRKLNYKYLLVRSTKTKNVTRNKFSMKVKLMNYL